MARDTRLAQCESPIYPSSERFQISVSDFLSAQIFEGNNTLGLRLTTTYHEGMSESALKSKRRWTWAEYQTWNDDQRWEIIGGETYAMSPSPLSRHQWIVSKLAGQLHPYFTGKACHLFLSPMDVVLSEEDVVQPDLLVVCDSNQIKRTHIQGPPTLVVEVLSDSSTVRDRRLKLDLYARSGVKEYWIVTPWPSLVEVLVLEAGVYVVRRVFDKEQTLTSPTFPELQVKLANVFSFPLEPGEEPPVVKEPPGSAYRTS